MRLPWWRESLALLNVQCCHLVSGASGSNISRLVCHTTLLPQGGSWPQPIIYILNIFIFNYYIHYTVNRRIISKFSYFAGNYPASPPGADHMTPCGFALSLTVMATRGTYPQNLGQEEHEVIAFLRQNIARCLAYEASIQKLPQTHLRVIQAMRAYFNLGPTSHRAFDRLVWSVATGQ